MNVKSGKSLALASAAALALTAAGFAAPSPGGDSGRASVTPPPPCHDQRCDHGDDGWNGHGNGHATGTTRPVGSGSTTTAPATAMARATATVPATDNGPEQPRQRQRERQRQRWRQGPRSLAPTRRRTPWPFSRSRKPPSRRAAVATALPHLAIVIPALDEEATVGEVVAAVPAPHRGRGQGRA